MSKIENKNEGNRQDHSVSVSADAQDRLTTQGWAGSEPHSWHPIKAGTPNPHVLHVFCFKLFVPSIANATSWGKHSPSTKYPLLFYLEPALSPLCHISVWHEILLIFLPVPFLCIYTAIALFPPSFTWTLNPIPQLHPAPWIYQIYLTLLFPV